MTEVKAGVEYKINIDFFSIGSKEIQSVDLYK